jgi:beta-lactamase class C
MAGLRPLAFLLFCFRQGAILAIAGFLLATLLPVRVAADDAALAVTAPAPAALEPATPAVIEEPVVPSYVEVFENKLDLAMRTGEFVGLSAAVIEGGRITFIKSWGETAAGSGDPVSTDTVFRFASVSKSFSAALVGQLVEEGRLHWSDPVTQYEPEFRLKTTAATNAVTIEDLASHRVGLPSHAYDDLIEAGRSFDVVVEQLRRADLVCQPGQCYQYQNVAYSLLGPVVEQVDGRSFDEAMNERIFGALGMDTASVGLEGLTGSESWARGHSRRRVGSAWQPFTPNNNYYRVAPAGGLNGSIEDLALWARAQMGYNPDVIDDGLREDLQTSRVRTPGERSKNRWLRSRLRDADYALGWRIYDYAGERMIMHSGGVSGYRALVTFLPEHDVGMVALWNTSNSLGWRILPTFYDAYLELDETDWLGVRPIQLRLEAQNASASGSP